MPRSSLTFRVFVSSTFSDQVEERNALQERVFPRLQELCRKQGCRFQAIDLRWAVSHEASLDQRTLSICMEEIARCRNVTPRPNFLALLGDRYGWRPLPDEIPAEEYETLAKHIPSGSDHELLTRWYRCDENAVPPVFVLQPRLGRHSDYATWEREVEHPLRRALSLAAKSTSLTRRARLKYGASATEQEIVRGALGQPDAKEHVFCFFRTIRGAPSGQEVGTFFDLTPDGEPDEEASRRLSLLKRRLRTRLGANIHEYEATWTGNGISTDHLDVLCTDVYDRLEAVIRLEMARLQLQTDLQSEIREHEARARRLRRHFVGRTSATRTIARYLNDDALCPLVIWGDSGSGKSALLAETAARARRRNKDANTILRFVGATPDSLHQASLLRGLCAQIAEAYGVEHEAEAEGELEISFHDLLNCATADRPLRIFIDAVDQIREADVMPTLSWLPSWLPDHAHIVVSLRSGKSLDALSVRHSPPDFIEVEPMSAKEGEVLLDRLQKSSRRSLRPAQRSEVMRGFRKSGLPLYMWIAFEEARRWRSYEETPHLADGVPGLLRQLMTRLADPANHGPLTASKALGYLRCSRNGLSEDELLEILARDDEYFRTFTESSRHHLPVGKVGQRQIPVVVWSRLRHDLEPFLLEQTTGGTPLLTFQHDAFGAAVDRAFLNDDNRRDLHTALAQNYAEQPLWLGDESASLPNHRKTAELPFQLLRSGHDEESLGTLSQFEFLYARQLAAGPLALLSDFDLPALFRPIPRRSEDPDELGPIRDAVHLSAKTLLKDRTQLPAQLFGRLMSSKLPAICDLLRQIETWEGRAWLCPQFPVLSQPGGSLRRILGSHRAPVTALAVTPDGKRILSGSEDGILRVWSIKEGRELRTLVGHASRITAIAVAPDGRCATASDEPGIKLWDLDSGVEAGEFSRPGMAMSERAVAFSEGGSHLLTASNRGLVVCWDTKTGNVIKAIEVAIREAGAVTISEDGLYGAWGCSLGTIVIWDFQKWKELRRVKHDADWSEVISEGGLGPVDWDSQAARHATSGIGSVAVSSAHRCILSGSVDGSVMVWDMDSGVVRASLRRHADRLSALALMPDGRRVVSGSEDGILKIWDLPSGDELHTLLGTSSKIHATAIIPPSGPIVSASDDGSLGLWAPGPSDGVKERIAHEACVTALAITPDGDRAFSAAQDGRLMTWDLERTGERVSSRDLAESTPIAIASDGRRILFRSREGVLQVQDLEREGAESGCRELLSDSSDVAMASNGIRAVAISSGTIVLLDLETGQRVRTLGSHPSASRVRLTPDAKTAISLGTGETQFLRVWDVDAGRVKRELPVAEERLTWAISLALSADGSLALTGSMDGILKAWDLLRGQEIGQMKSRGEWMCSLALTPDGTRAVTVSGGTGALEETGFLEMWDVARGALIASFCTEGPLTECAIHSAGNLVICAEESGRVHILRLMGNRLALEPE